MSIISAGVTTTTSLVQTGNIDGTLQLQVNGTTPSVTLATTGAVGVGTVPSYGTAGQVLTSQGAGAAPTWTSATSQWTTSGSDIYYNTGKVLVGTTTAVSGENFTVFGAAGISQGSDTNSYFAMRGSNSYFYSAGPLITVINNIERARFNTTGALVFAGGDTAANGIGITFPATQSASSDANTLDDYEEGTWTPVVGGVTLTGAGRYTKVGRLVSISFANQSGIPALAVGARMDCTGIPFGVVAGAWANTAIPSIGWNNASLSFLDELACGRLDPTNTISMFNRGTEATTTADSWGMSLVYYTS